jgi:hypothetical protein
MKSRINKVSLAVALGLALVAGPVVSAQAETLTVNTGSAVTAAVGTRDAAAIAAYKAAKAEYKVALAAYKVAKADYKSQRAAHKAAMAELSPALKAYAAAKKVIGQTFSASIKAAKDAYKLATTGTVTPEAKLAAKNAFEQAKADATAVRAAAIAALGAAPEKPAAPAKDAKPVKPTKPVR